MRFPSRTPSSLFKSLRLAALCRRAGFRHPLTLGVLLATLAGPGSSLADGLDVALHVAETPSGEVSASLGFGPVAVTARHIEYLGYLNHAYRTDGAGEEDPLVRRSEIDGGGLLGLQSGAVLPLRLAVALDEWEGGRRDLRLAIRSGLHLPGLRLDHSLTVTTRFAADGSESRHSAGRLVFGFDFLGGAQESVLEYDVEPTSQITVLGINSDWRFADGASALVSIRHTPLDAVSKASFGFRQAVGPFDMTSDFTADSQGAYAIGVSFAFDLGPVPDTPSWSLAALMAGLATVTD